MFWYIPVKSIFHIDQELAEGNNGEQIRASFA